MTYARSRLWLGMTAVGSLVVICFVASLMGLPSRWLPNGSEFSTADFAALGLLLGMYAAFMLGFDLLGGYVIPRRHDRWSGSLGSYLRRWMLGIAIQSSVFMINAIVLLALGRHYGVGGALVYIGVTGVLYIGLQGPLTRLLTRRWIEDIPDASRVAATLKELGICKSRVAVVRATDPGFTGGVTGLPGLERIVLPEHWLKELSTEQLRIVILRRCRAIQTGQRTLGLLVGLSWVVIGFGLSTQLPGGGVQSVAELATTICGFTIWSFLGLLILPSLSRNASHRLDADAIENGVSRDDLRATIETIDRLQDDEPTRPALIETIFHPVPAAGQRAGNVAGTNFGAWHAARSMLFVSWASVGLLARAVHCNAGRPELWMMLPSD